MDDTVKKVKLQEENILSDNYISTNIDDCLNKEKELTKSKKDQVSNDKKGNGFCYWGSLSKAGRDKDGKTITNQDTILLHLNVGGISGFNLFGILDGHGPHGHFVSQFCIDYFIKKMTIYAEFCMQSKITTPEQIFSELKRTKFAYIIDTFKESDIKMSSKNNFDTQFSGTTCNIFSSLINIYYVLVLGIPEDF